MILQSIYTTAREQPSKLAVIYNGREFSYAGFAGAISSTISFLEAEDLPADHTVVVIIYTLIDCWVTVLALQAMGLNTVCVQSQSMIEALGLEHIGVVTTSIEYSKHQLEPNTGTGSRIIVIPDPVYNSSVWPKVPGLKDKKIIGGHILYTSGTTGSYKNIFLQGSLQARRNAERIASSTYYDANTKYHCNAFGLWTAAGYRNPPATWQAGGCVIFEQRPEWYRYFLQSGMTHAILIPDMVHQLLQFLDEQPSILATDFHLLVSAGFISRNMAERIICRVPKNLENLYGSTEMYRPVLRSIVSNLDDLHWLETPEYRRIEIVDGVGNLCPINVEGQLRVHPEETDCHSYLDNSQASEKVFRDGYFYPGDMAVRRADG
ncbi:MAG TPA: AMP-binding protein, partial [Halioglobus sp.]